MAGEPGRIFYRIGAGVALAAGFLEIWINLAVGIVGREDNPVNQGFYLIVATAAACAFVARLRPDGMARAMLAVAAMQALLAVAVATAPSTARDEPMGAAGVLALSAAFCALWLLAAALFQRSARAP
jgi:2-methylcitrate dehydratase PrpD